MKNSILSALFLIQLAAIGGNNDNTIGARSISLSGNSIQFQDVWSVQNNPAGLGFIEYWAVGMAYRNEFSLSELATKSIALAYSLNQSGFGLSINQFGYSSYQENSIGLSYGKQLGKYFSMGIQLNYLSTQIAEPYGKNSAFSGTIGLQAKITDDLSLAAVVVNPSHTKLAEYEDERYPTLLKLGLAYEFSKKVQAFTEAVKDIDFNEDLKFGIEYHPIEILFLRVGYSTYPSQTSFGFGLELRNFTVDLASSFDSNLGFSPSVSLSYTPSKKP